MPQFYEQGAASSATDTAAAHMPCSHYCHHDKTVVTAHVLYSIRQAMRPLWFKTASADADCTIHDHLPPYNTLPNFGCMQLGMSRPRGRTAKLAMSRLHMLMHEVNTLASTSANMYEDRAATNNTVSCDPCKTSIIMHGLNVIINVWY